MPFSVNGSTIGASSLHSQEREISDPPRNMMVGTDPGGEEKESSPRNGNDLVTISSEAKALRELQARDREVRAHEAAHAAAGGSYAGSPTYSFQKGPDGRSYAVGGEVQINTSKIPGDPEATLEKAQTIRAAALAPARPSSADLAIASKAGAMAAEARAELAAETEKQITRQMAGSLPLSGGLSRRSGSLLDKYA